MSEVITPQVTDTEVELRVFEIDSQAIRRVLEELGATALGSKVFKRAVLDVHPVDPNKWIRVRTSGDITTLSVKQRGSGDGHDGEVEVVVDDFDTTLKLLETLNGYIPRSVQESRREAYQLDGAEVTIDTWPKIQDFLEIEADDNTLETIYRVADSLGIERTQLTGKSVETYYEETLGIDIKTTPLRFEA